MASPATYNSFGFRQPAPAGGISPAGQFAIENYLDEQRRDEAQRMRDAEREAAKDPLDEEIKSLTARKTDLGRVRESVKNQRQAFMDTDGADLFDRDPLTGKPVIDPLTQKPVNRMGQDLYQRRLALPQNDAAALADFQTQEKAYKLKLDKWQRIEAEHDRIQQAELQAEARIGELAKQRLARSQPQPAMTAPGMVPQTFEAPQSQPAAQPAPVAGNWMRTGTTPSGAIIEQWQPQPQEAVAQPGRPFVGADGTSQPSKTSPLALIKLHRHVRNAEAAGDATTAASLREQAAAGYGQLDEAARARVEKQTQDPTFWGEVGKNAKDLAMSFGSGGNALLKMAGDLYGLATGDMENAASRQGREGMAYFEQRKSDDLRSAEDARRKAITEAPDELGKAWAYIRETATNPMLMGSAISEQLPNTVGAGGAGALVRKGAEKILLRSAATEAAKRLALKRAAQAGVGAAVGAGAAMQGADVGADQYDDLVTRLDAMPASEAAQIPEIANLMDRGATLDEAKLALALTKARETGVIAAGLSVGAQMLPGGRTLERTLAGGATKGAASAVASAVAGGAGEALSEVVEEAGGRMVANVGAQPVDPTRPITQGVGEAAGQAIVTAGPMGAGAGAINARRGEAPAAEGEAETQPTPPTVPPQAEAEPDVAPTLDPEVLAELQQPFAAPPVQENVSADAAPKVVAEQPAAPAPSQPPAEPTADYRYAVQRPQVYEGREIPGYVQVDEIVGGQNTRSSNVEALRQEGVDLPTPPDWLPTGNYTRAEIEDAIRRGPPAVESVSTQEPQPSPAGSMPNPRSGEIPAQPGTQAGSAPAPVSIGVAQSEEQRSPKPPVAGSSPAPFATQGSSVEERRGLFADDAGSMPAPAPISEPAPAPAGITSAPTAPAGDESGAAPANSAPSQPPASASDQPQAQPQPTPEPGPAAGSDLDAASPRAQRWRDVPPAATPSIEEQRARSFEAALNRERAKQGQGPVRFIVVDFADASGEPAADAGTDRAAFSETARRLSRAFSKRIVFFRSSEPIGQVGMTAPQLANTILVNAEAEHPLNLVVGHELAHNVKSHRKEWWGAMRDAIQEQSPMSAEYAAFKRSQGYSTEQALDEWVSDHVGERFDEPAFWQAFDRALQAKEGTTGFLANVKGARAAADWIAGWIKKLGDRIRKVFIGSHSFVSDMDALQDRIARVMADYAEVASSLPENAEQAAASDVDLVEPISLQTSTPGAPGDTAKFRKTAENLREAGVPIERQPYQPRSEETVKADAKQAVADLGADEALRRASDPADTSLPGDVKTRIWGDAIVERTKVLADPKATKEARAAAQRDIERFTAPERTAEHTDIGQQINALKWVYRDTRAAATAEYMDEVTKRQDRGLGENGKKAVDAATDALNKAAREAVERAGKGIADVVRQQPVNRTLWQQYRDAATKRMLDWFDGRLDVPADKAPLQDFMGRVVAEMRGRLEAVVPEKPGSETPKPTPGELLREAMDNKGRYGEVFDSVRAAFAKEYGEDSPIMEEIDLALANMGAKPYSQKLIDRAVKEAHKAMRVKVSELAQQHLTKTDAQAKDLADALVTVAGMNGADALQVAQDLEARAKALVADARAKALDALKKRHDTPKARKILDVVERTLQLNNLGAFSRADLVNAVSKQLQLPGVKPEQLQKIASMADKVETAGNALDRARAEYDLVNELRVVRGITKSDVALSLWFANLLSGPMTHAANASSNVMTGTLQLATIMATNPRQGAQALRGYIEGFGDGWLHARDIVKTGRSLREMGELSKSGEAGNVLEVVDYTRDFPSLPNAIAKGFQAHANAMRYVSRFMRAADALFYYPAREAYSRVATAKLLEGQYEGAELHKKVRETLGIAPDQFVRFREQAKQEGWKGLDLSLRVSQLVELHRSSSDVGLNVEQRAEQFGRETTYNQEPVGIAGAVYRNLRDMTSDLPALKVFLPFLRVPTNIFNTSLNFTPIGAVRARFGVQGTEKGARKEFTAEERARLYFQATAGSLAMVGLYALARSEGDDREKEPFFTITARGPSDYRQRQQLEATGWKEYSIKLGDRWVSYKDSPLLLPLASVGHAIDAERYQATRDQLLGKNPYLNAILKFPQAIFETSMLSGMGTLMDAAQGNVSADQLENFLARTAASSAIPNLASQIDRMVSPEAREPDGVLGRAGQAIPGLRTTGSVKTDVLAEPVERSPLDRFVKMETNDPVREVLRDKNVFISVPNRSTKIGQKPMEPEQYRDYVRVSGERIRQRLSGYVPMLRRMNPEQVEQLVDKITEQERMRAKQIVARGMVPSTSRN